MPSQRGSTACRDGCGWSDSGQGTVEFALVVAAFIAVAIAFGALWRLFGEGKAMEHALMSASHHIQLAAAGALPDILLY